MSVVLFGKLPAHGDFVARGLSGAERDWWDERLSLGMARAMVAAVDAFDARYDAAEPWCFRIRLGDTVLSGVMVPSVDRAGRRFPLIVARRAPDAAAACLAVMQDAAARQDDADALVMRVAQADDAAAAPCADCWWADPAMSDASIDSDDPADAVAAMLAGATM